MSLHNPLANALRMLSIDAVEEAKSGHPGMPMGMADIAEVLWRDFLKHNPSNPHWINRDRFVLSNGHGSMLLYALLHLSGYDLSIDDLKSFRQLHSKTPGHPEYGLTPGVETTTGPLGQGFANAVGMALAEQVLAATYNRPKFTVIDHFTYVFVGDGCLMEGISHEVASLAGNLGLGKLIVCYDANGISIDGRIVDWFSDNTAQRFQAYGWHVIDDIDGHNRQAITKAFNEAKSNVNRPTLIIFNTIIGYGSPNCSDSAKSHGSPLGADEVAATRQALSWEHPPFHIPDDIYQAWDATEKGERHYNTWLTTYQAYQQLFPVESQTLHRRCHGDLAMGLKEAYQALLNERLRSKKPEASRKSSEICLTHFTPHLPELLGGSADLSGSNNTYTRHSQAISATHFDGNYLHYGVREFGMAGIMNGLALHGGFIPYGGTFLVFADYARNAIRLSAMMGLKAIYVLTHDSIGLGEDGPTHQPVEHLTMLRCTPELAVWRPADGFETAVAWYQAITQPGSKAIVLSRQPLTQQPHKLEDAETIGRGGYILQEDSDRPALVLMASGSEIQLAVEAARALNAQGFAIRVVSMPCVEVFLCQSAQYCEHVLPCDRPRIAIEAGRPESWYRWTCDVIGVASFGLSAPGEEAFQAMSVTVSSVVSLARARLVASQ